jgi:spore coat polysaccharide biosynthesis protein SpsF
MKIVAIIEARMGSTRLAGKHLKKILGRPVLELLVERVKKTPSINKIVLATTTQKRDDILEKLAKKINIKCFRGSEDDVLGRVLAAAQSTQADLIVETLGDCPLTDPELIEQCIQVFLQNNYDYVSNSLKRTFANGFDVQVYPTKILAEVDGLTDDPIDREHVTTYIYQHPKKYKIKNISAKGDLHWPELVITLDTPKNLQLIKVIFENLYPKNSSFSALDIVRFLRKNPQLLKINKNIKRKVIVCDRKYEK